jgi:hypothetical protein
MKYEKKLIIILNKFRNVCIFVLYYVHNMLLYNILNFKFQLILLGIRILLTIHNIQYNFRRNTYNKHINGSLVLNYICNHYLFIRTPSVEISVRIIDALKP